MKLSISADDLSAYYSTQLNNLFPDSDVVSKTDLSKIIDVALDRLHFIFKHVKYERYNDGSHTFYNHLYADHNIVFNWLLANSAYVHTENKSLCSKLYYLNKVMHAFDCMYDTDLPEIFLVFHGAGTMLGKAKYSDFFVALQGVTVGSNNGAYPEMGKGVSLTAHSSVIGNCKIGDYSSVSANTNVFDRSIPEKNVAFRDSKGEIIIKATKSCYADNFFFSDLLFGK